MWDPFAGMHLCIASDGLPKALKLLRTPCMGEL